MKIKLLLLSFLFILTSCAVTQSSSLFTEMGGEQKINAIVNDLIVEIGNDPVIFPYFEKASVTHFRKGLYAHLCDVTDGPCAYKGDSMREIHTGMHVSEKAFNRLVELLIAAMDKNNIANTTQNKLLAKLAPMRDDVMVDG